MALPRVCMVILLVVTPAVGNDTWKLVWSDEFDKGRNEPPDTSKWTYDLGSGGWGNHELQTYTGKAENVFHDGHGHLAIRATKNGEAYSSARLTTRGIYNVRYGRIAARIKVPVAQGIWATFWLLGSDLPRVGWPNCGEIDIMEITGRAATTNRGSIHGPGYSAGNSLFFKYSLPSGGRFDDRFHVFEIRWSEFAIKFLLDDRQYFEVKPSSLAEGSDWVFKKPFFLILNLAVGGDFPGPPSSGTAFPQTMLVDWVRVWQLGLAAN